MVSLDEFIKAVADTFNMYFEIGGLNHMALLIVSIILILLFSKSRRIKDINVFLPIAIVIFVILNPVAYVLFEKTYEYSYYRTFWMILTPFIIGTAVCVVMSRMEEGKRIVPLLIAVILIISTGPIIGMHDRLRPIQNVYRLDSQVIEIADMIMKDECKDKKAVVPDEIAWQIRQYKDIKLLYGRARWDVYNKNADKTVYEMINGERDFNTDEVIRLVRDVDFKYIVLKADMADDIQMKEYGFECIGATYNYKLYKSYFNAI